MNHPVILGELSDFDGHVSLLDYVCINDVHDPTLGDTIDITLVGHSLGAGIGQLALGALSGLALHNVQENGEFDVAPLPDWPFNLRHAFLFAPPLSVYTSEEETCRRMDEATSPLAIYARNGISEHSYMVIHRGDMIPTIWNPLSANDVHCVLGEHFGHLVDISRNGDVTIHDDVDWSYERPHHTWTYRNALMRAMTKNNGETTDD